MVDPKHLATEIARLRGLNFFSADPFAINEIRAALDTARTDIIATTVINDWLESSSERPTPADLRKLIQPYNVEYDRVAARHSRELEKFRFEDVGRPGRAHCARCKGEGIVESIHADDLKSIATWCDCEAGRRAQSNSCRCPETADGRCSRLTERGECVCPPWRVNFARGRLLKMDQAYVAKTLNQTKGASK